MKTRETSSRARAPPWIASSRLRARVEAQPRVALHRATRHPGSTTMASMDHRERSARGRIVAFVTATAAALLSGCGGGGGGGGGGSNTLIPSASPSTVTATPPGGLLEDGAPSWTLVRRTA